MTISTGMLAYVPVVGAHPAARRARGRRHRCRTRWSSSTPSTPSIVPTLLVVLMALHFWRVRKAGGVVVPRGTERGREPAAGTRCCSCPHLLVREASLALVIPPASWSWPRPFGAPLGEPANPGMSPNPAKAPWYFIGFQELLVHFHPVRRALLIVPLAGVLGAARLPYVTRTTSRPATWFLSARGRRLQRHRRGQRRGADACAGRSRRGAARRAWPGARRGWHRAGSLPLAVLVAARFAAVRPHTRLAPTTQRGGPGAGGAAAWRSLC